jgi:hypothetical protein
VNRSSRGRAGHIGRKYSATITWHLPWRERSARWMSEHLSSEDYNFSSLRISTIEWHLFNLYIISWWSNSFALVWTSTRLTCSSFGRVTNQSLSMMPISSFIIDGIVGSGRGGEVRGEILTARRSRVDFSCQSRQLPLLPIHQGA